MSNNNININLNKLKYLKYKKKYLNLKKMFGSGGTTSSVEPLYFINIVVEFTDELPDVFDYWININENVIKQIARNLSENKYDIKLPDICVCMRTLTGDLVIINNNNDFVNNYSRTNNTVYIILVNNIKAPIGVQFREQKEHNNLGNNAYVSNTKNAYNETEDDTSSQITPLQLIDEYKTVIIDKNIIRIIALSDIHSDIHAFIICLRDCAKVIRKKDNIMMDINSLDQDTENLLELNLNTNESDYKDDLNYEWIGENTHIVICGDILDGARKEQETSTRYGINRCADNKCKDLEYDQVEIKLLRFINSINKLAMIKNGRIYKILGNHDIANLAGDNKLITNYNPKYTLSLGINYHQGISRQDYFKKGQLGYDLLFKDNAYMFLVINNNIFVHGQLEHIKSLEEYIIINNNLNNNGLNINRYNKSSTTWGRYYSRTNRIKDNRFITQREQVLKCQQVQDNLQKIFRNLTYYNNNYNILYNSHKALRVIKGHCVQMLGNGNNIRDGTINTTFNNVDTHGNIQILSGNTITGMQRNPDTKTDPNPILNSQDDYLFGIGMECNKENLDEFIINPETSPVIDNDERYIYKVDIGSSRAFDTKVNNDYINYDADYINNITQRLPQVLEMQGNDIRIIRSTVKNTRIHQPRGNAESLLKDTDSEYMLN